MHVRDNVQATYGGAKLSLRTSLKKKKFDHFLGKIKHNTVNFLDKLLIISKLNFRVLFIKSLEL